jgi:ribosomal-protein-alanine N-acetyltransferase
MSIRSAKISDIGSIAAIEHKSFTPPWSEAMIESEFAHDSTYIIVSEIEKQIAGYCIVHDISDFAEILKIAVDTDLRHRGIGRALLSECESFFHKKDKAKILLEVNENNQHAITLYLSAGFVQTGRRKGYYGDEAALLMEKRLRDDC